MMKYYSSEIDKDAILITQKNHPNTIQLGDVTKVDGTKLDKVNLLIGGSPCQGFSLNKADHGATIRMTNVSSLKKPAKYRWLFILQKN